MPVLERCRSRSAGGGNAERKVQSCAGACLVSRMKRAEYLSFSLASGGQARRAGQEATSACTSRRDAPRHRSPKLPAPASAAAVPPPPTCTAAALAGGGDGVVPLLCPPRPRPRDRAASPRAPPEISLPSRESSHHAASPISTATTAAKSFLTSGRTIVGISCGW